jgi:hypothetical protein
VLGAPQVLAVVGVGGPGHQGELVSDLLVGGDDHSGGDAGLGIPHPGDGAHGLENLIGGREVLVEGMQLLAGGKRLADDADMAGGGGEVLDDAPNDPGEVGQEHGQQRRGGQHRARGEQGAAGVAQRVAKGQSNPEHHSALMASAGGRREAITAG